MPSGVFACKFSTRTCRLKSGLRAYGRLSASADRSARPKNVLAGDHAAERLQHRIPFGECAPNLKRIRCVVELDFVEMK